MHYTKVTRMRRQHRRRGCCIDFRATLPSPIHHPSHFPRRHPLSRQQPVARPSFPTFPLPFYLYPFVPSHPPSCSHSSHLPGQLLLSVHLRVAIQGFLTYPLPILPLLSLPFPPLPFLLTPCPSSRRLPLPLQQPVAGQRRRGGSGHRPGAQAQQDAGCCGEAAVRGKQDPRILH